MDGSLWSSVEATLDGPAFRSASGRSAPSVAGSHPLDYGAYFDLVLTPPGGAPDRTELEDARAHLSGRLAGKGAGAPASPAVSNLSDYCEQQADRLRRWWDIEAENAMGLSGVSPDYLAAAQSHIEKALGFLSAAAPEMHGEVIAIVREIVIAQPDGSQRMDFGGASSFALWGGFTINAATHSCWPDFYKTIVHETAHNLLFAIARDQPLVEDDVDDRHASPLREDARPMDGIFHAAFVSAREACALDALLVHDDSETLLTPDERPQVEDMLEESVLAFHDCATTLHAQARMSDLGVRVLQECSAWIDANFAVATE